MKKMLTVVAVVTITIVFFNTVSASSRGHVEVVDMGDYILFYSSTANTVNTDQSQALTDGADVVIYCHGGFSKTNSACPGCRFLARQGFIIAAPKYSAANNLQADIQDVRKVRDAFTKVKHNSVFLAGVSRGGFLALQTLLLDNAQYDGAVIVAAPTSVSTWKTSVELSAQLKDYFASGMDAVANAARIQIPMYLLYGTEDDVVPASQGKMLWEKNPDLFEFKTLPADHGNIASSQAFDLIGEWLKTVITGEENDESFE